MESDRRLTQQGEERRRQLLDHAAALFAERGFAETRIIDIVDSAGVAKGLFYWYFDNKEALFADVAADIRLRLRRHQGAAMDRLADPLTQVRQGCEASLEFMAEHAHFFSLLEVENVGAQFADVLRKGTDQHLEDVTTLIRAGQSEGLVKDEDPRLLAVAVVGTVGYFAHFHRSGRLEMPVEELAAFVGRTVVATLAADDRVARSALAPGGVQATV